MDKTAGQDTHRFPHYAGALFLMVAAIFLVWQMVGPGTYRNIHAEITSQPYSRTITVDGEGKITAKPDIALVSFSVVTQAKTVKEATTEGNFKMTEVIDALKKLGLDSNDLTTTQYHLNPQYVSSDTVTSEDLKNVVDASDVTRVKEMVTVSDGASKVGGYQLYQTLQVKIRNLDQTEDVIDTAVKSGANEVGQLAFDIDDPSSLKKEAREKAFKVAREKAEDMASAAGVKLGKVVNFSEGYNYVPYANFRMDVSSSMGKEMAPAVPAPSIEPGSQEIQLTVSVTYEIE